MNVQQVSYQTIGSNKEKPRLWIEGVKLSTAGFVRGAMYHLNIEKNEIQIILDPNGARKVSGRKRGDRDIPILDIALRELEENFDAGTRVRVVFTQGRISVTLHHEEKARIDREKRLADNLAAGSLTEASMFTGGGISTHAIHSAIEDAGSTAQLAWVVDSELKYLQTGYANNFAITDDTVALIGRAEEIEAQYFTSVDILSFSMPCSGFSTAGKSKHGQAPEAHEGAAALFGTLSAIRAANPAVLISENVVEAQNAAAYVLLKTELARLGYEVFERVMTAADTGTIEKRSRYWFVALSKGIAKGFDFSLIHVGATEPARQIAEILEKNVPEDAWAANEYLHAKAERDAAAGKGFARQLLTGEETNCGTIGRHYMKRRSTEPFLTRGDGLERLFTPVEHARVKSVPEALVAGTPATTAHEILGQSVDWRQAYTVAGCIMAHVAGKVSHQLRRTRDGVVEAVEVFVEKTAKQVDTQPCQLALF